MNMNVDGIFSYGTKHIIVEDWDDFELDDFEEYRHGYPNQHIEIIARWKGKVKTSIGFVEVKIEDYKESENGGVSIEIVSEKPNGINKEIWDEFEQFLQNFIDEKYDFYEWAQSLRW